MEGTAFTRGNRETGRTESFLYCLALPRTSPFLRFPCWKPFSPQPRSSITLLELADLAATAPVGGTGSLSGGAIDTLHPAHLRFLRRRLRGHIVIEGARFPLLDVLIDEDADDEVLVASEAAADADAIAFAHGAIRLGVIAVDVDLSALAGPLRFGPRLEQAGDVQPDV